MIHMVHLRFPITTIMPMIIIIDVDYHFDDYGDCNVDYRAVATFFEVMGRKAEETLLDTAYFSP